MGAGLRTRAQRRRYESCRGSLGASGAKRCQHETGCNALREEALVCVEECGAAAAAAVRGGGAWPYLRLNLRFNATTYDRRPLLYIEGLLL